MDKLFICKAILTASVIGISMSALSSPQEHTYEVKQISENSKLPDNKVRLRIYFILDQNIPSDEPIDVGTIRICSLKSCYSIKPTNKILLSNEANIAKSITVSMPIEKMATISIDSINNTPTYTSELLFDNPPNIDYGVYGEALFIILDKKIDSTGASYYTPKSTTTGLFGKDQEVLLYNPKNRLQRNIGNGVFIDIPSKATLTPKSFSISIHDIGNDFPLIDIYPKINFLKPITLKVSKIMAKRRSNSITPPTVQHPSNRQIEQLSTKTLNITNTGVIDPNKQIQTDLLSSVSEAQSR